MLNFLTLLHTDLKLDQKDSIVNQRLWNNFCLEFFLPSFSVKIGWHCCCFTCGWLSQKSKSKLLILVQLPFLSWCQSQLTIIWESESEKAKKRTISCLQPTNIRFWWILCVVFGCWKRIVWMKKYSFSWWVYI